MTIQQAPALIDEAYSKQYLRKEKTRESPIFQGETATLTIQAEIVETHFVVTPPAELQKM